MTHNKRSDTDPFTLPLVIIVIPCYNEARRFNTQAFKAFTPDRYQVRFLFVDDGSTDETWNVLQSLSALDRERFLICRLPRNVGKGEAVRQGLLQAFRGNPDYVGYWDADLATPLSALPAFYEVLKTSQFEMVFGARVRLLGRAIERSPLRHYLGRVFATMASLVLGIPIYDTQCGAKLFRVSPAVSSLFQGKFLTRWLFDVEILARLIQSSGLNRRHIEGIVYEFPLHEWHDVAGSKVRARDFAKSLVGLARIYWHYLRAASVNRCPVPPNVEPHPEPKPKPTQGQVEASVEFNKVRRAQVEVLSDT
jgi:dolichyl-phosphate beta-glucosyltransferase